MNNKSIIALFIGIIIVLITLIIIISSSSKKNNIEEIISEEEITEEQYSEEEEIKGGQGINAVKEIKYYKAYNGKIIEEDSNKKFEIELKNINAPESEEMEVNIIILSKGKREMAKAETKIPKLKKNETTKLSIELPNNIRIQDIGDYSIENKN